MTETKKISKHSLACYGRKPLQMLMGVVDSYLSGRLVLSPYQGSP